MGPAAHARQAGNGGCPGIGVALAILQIARLAPPAIDAAVYDAVVDPEEVSPALLMAS
jgi:hypothetical protein